MKIVLISLFFTFTLHAKEKAPFLAKSFHTEFKQIIVSTLKGKKNESFGTLYYLYPGRVKLELTKPEENKFTFVSNPDQSWYYKPPFISGEKGEVTISISSKNSKNTLFSRFFDYLKSGLVSNDNYAVKDEGAGVYFISFHEKAKKILGIENSKLHFRDSKPKDIRSLHQVDLTYEDKREVTFELKSIQLVSNLKEEDFVFKVPEGTNIVQ